MFKKKGEELNIDNYEDNTTLAKKEEEIIYNYNENVQSEIQNDEFIDEENENYIEDEVEDFKNRRKKYQKLINIFFIICIILIALVSIDVICVAKYDKGPFFALPLKKYDDGGSKAYYGLGYKVIKYNQKQGRKDKEIGFWSLKYNVEPITIEDLDLAIEMSGKEIKTYKKYYKKFVRLTSTLEKIDKKNNKIILSYKEEGKKYNLEFNCSLSNKNKLDNLKLNEKTTIIGTITNFEYKSKISPNKLYLSNCFVEQ